MPELGEHPDDFWIPASSIPALVWILDGDLRIVRANRAAGAEDASSLIGRRLRDLVPLAQRRRFDQEIQAVRRQSGGWMEIPVGEDRRSAGWLRFHFSKGTPDSETGYVALGFEAGEIHRLRRKYDLVLSVSSRLSSILEIDPLLAEVVKACKETFGFYNVNIGLVEGDEIVIRAGFGGYFGQPDGFYTGADRFRIGGPGILSHVAATGRPYYTPDVREDPRFAFFQPLADTVSEAAVPLKAKDRVVGALDVESDRVAGIGPEDLAVLEALAGPIAVAVENAGLYVVVKKAARRYYDLYENAPDMYHTAAPDGTVLECNRVEADKLGFAKAEIVGRRAEDLFAEDSRDLV
ncbi:MAG: GAF domain-containing protein, partial [Planctomycetes bacterium]|nr:GAF domain-containing protein [Planctomycetota bacterium]